MAMAQDIVVIDDDRVTSSMLKKVLSDNGYNVHTAFDGESGLQLVMKIKPALVILDMLLPKIHGANLCQKLKAEPELKKTKIILITAIYKEILVRAESRKWGAELFLEKPINTKELLRWIKENLDEGKIRDSSLPRIKIEAVDIDDVISSLKDLIKDE